MVAKANKAPMPSVSLVNINNNKFILSDVNDIDINILILELQGLATASEALIN